MAWTNVFLDVQATKDEVIKAGIAVFQYITPCTSYTSLGQIRYNLFSRKMATRVIKPDTLRRQRAQLHNTLSVPVSKPCRLAASAVCVFESQ